MKSKKGKQKKQPEVKSVFISVDTQKAKKPIVVTVDGKAMGINSGSLIKNWVLMVAMASDFIQQGAAKNVKYSFYLSPTLVSYVNNNYKWAIFSPNGEPVSVKYHELNNILHTEYHAFIVPEDMEYDDFDIVITYLRSI